MHGGRHVRDPRAPEGGLREGFPGRRQQGYQVLRQVQLHAQVHDVQLGQRHLQLGLHVLQLGQRHLQLGRHHIQHGVLQLGLHVQQLGLYVLQLGLHVLQLGLRDVLQLGRSPAPPQRTAPTAGSNINSRRYTVSFSVEVIQYMCWVGNDAFCLRCYSVCGVTTFIRRRREQPSEGDTGYLGKCYPVGNSSVL